MACLKTLECLQYTATNCIGLGHLSDRQVEREGDVVVFDLLSLSEGEGDIVVLDLSVFLREREREDGGGFHL